MQLVSTPWGANDVYAPGGLIPPVLKLLKVLAEGERNPTKDGEDHATSITIRLLTLVSCFAKNQRVGQQMLSQGVLVPIVKVHRLVSQLTLIEWKIHF